MARKEISLVIFYSCIFLLYSSLSYSYSDKKVKAIIQSRYENKITNDAEDNRIERSSYYTKIKLYLKEGFEFSFAGVRKTESLEEANYYESDYSLFSLGFYLRFKDSPLTMLAVGNYILSIGQELVFGSAYYSPIYLITNPPFKKRGSGINSYVYPGASGSLMGSAFSLSFGNVKVLSFIFDNEYPLPANKFVNGAFAIDYGYLVSSSSSFQYDNNPEETKTLNEFGLGADISYETKDFKVGALVSYTMLSDNLAIFDEALYENTFNSNELFIGSLHFNAYLNNYVNIYGEFALSSYYDYISGDREYGFAGLFGTIVKYKLLSFMFLFRYLDDNYHAPHSSLVIDNRIDEIGFSNGIALDLARGLFIQLFFDVFKPVSLMEEKDLWYYDYSVRLIYEPVFGLHISYFFGERFKNYYSTMRDRRKHQLNVKYTFYNDRISIKFRYENIYSKREDEPVGYLGDLFYIQSTVSTSKYYSFFTRITYYNASDYTASIYVYESHLPYWYSSPTRFSDKGIKFDFILKLYFGKASFGIRWSIDRRIPEKEYNNLFANIIYKW